MSNLALSGGTLNGTGNLVVTNSFSQLAGGTINIGGGATITQVTGSPHARPDHGKWDLGDRADRESLGNRAVGIGGRHRAHGRQRNYARREPHRRRRQQRDPHRHQRWREPDRGCDQRREPRFAGLGRLCAEPDRQQRGGRSRRLSPAWAPRSATATPTRSPSARSSPRAALRSASRCPARRGAR